MGEDVGAKYLVAFTHSGDSARRLARLRSEIPVLAFTPVEDTRGALTLSWGVESFLVPMVDHTDDMIRQVDKALIETGMIAEGERVVIVAGSPPGVAGHTLYAAAIEFQVDGRRVLATGAVATLSTSREKLRS